MEVGKFKSFMKRLIKIQVSIPFCEAFKQILVYEKFMKELLSRKRKLNYDENIALEKEYNAIIQRKVPPKLTDSGRFSTPCSIGLLTIVYALCDLGVSINLILLFMMRNSNCGKPKLTRMTFKLANFSITYPHRFLKYVLVRVDNLLFPTDFVILHMLEDYEALLLLGRLFLATYKALINMELGELILRFNKEKVVLNVLEAMKHHKENHRCYRTDIMEVIVQEVPAEETPSPPMDRVIINSAERVEDESGMEVAECLLQLQAI